MFVGSKLLHDVFLQVFDQFAKRIEDLSDAQTVDKNFTNVTAVVIQRGTQRPVFDREPVNATGIVILVANRYGISLDRELLIIETGNDIPHQFQPLFSQRAIMLLQLVDLLPVFFRYRTGSLHVLRRQFGALRLRCYVLHRRQR